MRALNFAQRNYILMDIATFGFVAFLCLIALLVTTSVRREFLTKEHERREQERQSQHTRLRRKP